MSLFSIPHALNQWGRWKAVLPRPAGRAVLATLGALALLGVTLPAGAATAEAAVPSLPLTSLGSGAKPVSSVADRAGNLFVLNEGDATVSKISSAGSVTRVFASLGAGVSPQAMTIDPKGYLFIACAGSDSVTRVSPTGLVTSYWAYDGRGSMPRSIASDRSGTVYVANWGTSTVTRIAAGGAVSTVFARLDPADRPLGLAVDSAGSVFVADTQTDRISLVTATGRVTESFATLPAGSRPVAVAVDPWGSVYVANAAGSVSKSGADGALLAAALPALPGSHRPTGLVLDPYGDVFIGDELSGDLTAVDAGGAVSTVVSAFAPGALVRAIALAGDSAYAVDYVTGDVRRAELGPSFTSGPVSGELRRGSPVSLDIGMGGYLPQVILSTGQLPNGLSLDEHTGHLAGIPTTLGTVDFDVVVLTHWGATAPRHEVLSVVP